MSLEESIIPESDSVSPDSVLEGAAPLIEPEDSASGDDSPAGPALPIHQPPLIAYQAALAKYPHAVASAIAGSIGLTDVRKRKAGLAELIAEALAAPRACERLVNSLDHPSRLLLGIFGLAESTSWSVRGITLSLSCLYVEFEEAIQPLLAYGLIVIDPVDDSELATWSLNSPVERWPTSTLRLFPGALSVCRTTLPLDAPPPSVEEATQIREPDGLEPLLRLAVLWQRVSEAPLRQTQSGALYKRDRDRIEDDPALVGPIADALEPLPDPAGFWIAVAQAVGLIERESNSERIVAAKADFWDDNAFHLPQMIASRWLTVTNWQEQAGARSPLATEELSLPHLRVAALLWLAKLEPDHWCDIADLADHLDRYAPGWHEPIIKAPNRGRIQENLGGLDAVLLGAAYQLGLIRVGSAAISLKRVVQLSALGRYVLGIGPPPPPLMTFDHFLFVQPNFEIVAYRQGLNPRLLGTLGRFARWNRIGAALELVLSPASIYQSLEGGFSEAEILEFLTKHSQRALPSSVAEAVRTWSSRRERVTYFSSATLVEFTSGIDLEAALAFWPPGKAGPVRIAERLLLVEDDTVIPFTRLRLAGSRDYRRAPEACIEVEADGVGFTLDLGRSDLLVDAEISRFADEVRVVNRDDGRRRFVVTAASLARAAERGMTPTVLAKWFPLRTGGPIPASIRLMLGTAAGMNQTLRTWRPTVLKTESSELLDGLLQHPATRSYFGDRLGPNSAVVLDDSLENLQRVAENLGLKWEMGESQDATHPKARSMKKN